MSTEPKTGLNYWPSGALQQDVLFNAFLKEAGAVGLHGTALDKDLATPPGSPAAGDTYIVAGSPTGAWTGHAKDLAYWDAAAWVFYTPREGWRIDVADEDAEYRYSGSAWALATAGTDSPVGKHAVAVMAGAIAPSVAGGCSALTSIASAANQPDIVTLDFDPTTQEYAQFAIPLPKSWNASTFTFQPIWSHAATTTNFGVVWNCQLVIVRNDDPIAVAFGTAQTSTDTGGTTDDLYYGPESAAITAAGTAADNCTLFGRISRVTGDGSDTMAIDARLHGIQLFLTTDAGTDA